MATLRVPEWALASKCGVIALFMIPFGFTIEFSEMMRPGQSCHPPVFDWFWRIGSFSFGVMLLGFLISMIGLIADPRRGRALMAFILFFLLMFLILAASGCG